MAKMVVKMGDAGYYWHMKNGSRITTDGETHPSKGNAVRAAKGVVNAVLKAVGYTATFTVKEKNGETVITWE